MSCSKCVKAKTVKICGNFLLLQIAKTPGTQYTIYLKNLTLGIVYQQEATVDLSGKLYFDFDAFDQDIYMEQQSYELWITLKNDTMDNHVPMIFVGESVDCVDLNFLHTYNEDDEPIEPYNIQYLQLT